MSLTVNNFLVFAYGLIHKQSVATEPMLVQAQIEIQSVCYLNILELR